MASSVMTFRLPEDLMQAIMSQAKATGCSRTAVVIDALRQSFGFCASETPATSLEGLHQQLDALRQEATRLNQQFIEFKQELSSDGNARSLEELNQALADHQALLNRVSSLSPTASQTQQVGAGMDLPNPSSVASQETESVNAQQDKTAEDLQQLAAKVEQRSRMLEQVLSASVDHVCMYDRLGRYTYANRAFMQSLGLERTELYGKTWQQLGLPPETMKPLEAKCKAVFATGQSIAEEINLQTVSGIRDYEYILSPIRSTDGSVEAVVYTARDMTERKHAQELLRQSEQNYRNLFEWAHDSIFITDYSTDHLLNVNEHGARRLGYTRKQILNLPPEVFSPPMPPHRRETVLKQLWRTGSVTFEHFHKCKNGNKMPIEVSSRVIEYGGRLAIQSFIRDIAQRKQAEEKLKVYREIIYRCQEAIAILDLQGRYIEQNPAHNLLLGYSDDELQSKTLASQLSDEVFAAVKRELGRNGCYRGEVTSRTKSGEWLTLELEAFVVRPEFTDAVCCIRLVLPGCSKSHPGSQIAA